MYSSQVLYRFSSSLAPYCKYKTAQLLTCSFNNVLNNKAKISRRKGSGFLLFKVIQHLPLVHWIFLHSSKNCQFIHSCYALIFSDYFTHNRGTKGQEWIQQNVQIRQRSIAKRSIILNICRSLLHISSSNPALSLSLREGFKKKHGKLSTFCG